MRIFFGEIAAKLKMFWCKLRYKDYKDDNFNRFEEQFIFGVPVRGGDLEDEEPSFATFNALELIYSRKTKKYTLNVMHSRNAMTLALGHACLSFYYNVHEVSFYEDLLNQLTAWMLTRGYRTELSIDPPDFLSEVSLTSTSIEAVYATFKLMVYGMKAYIKERDEWIQN